jgi:tetratricopeptide (TPR) repeat protein
LPFRRPPFLSDLIYSSELPFSWRLGDRRKVDSADRERRHEFLLEFARLIAEKDILYNSSKQHVIEGLVELGDMENALKIVAQLAEGPIKPESRFESVVLSRTLVDLGQAQARVGHKEEAFANFRRAIEFVEHHPEIPDFMRDSVVIATSIAHAQIGDYSEAIKTLDRGPAPRNRSYQLRMIARLQVKGGDIEAARETTLRTLQEAQEGLKHPDPSINRDGYLSLIAAIRSDLGEYAIAESLFDEIEEPYRKKNAAHDIAQFRAQNGDIAGATSWASSITDLSVRGKALEGVADGSKAKAR